MNDGEIARLIDFLKKEKGWTDAEIVELIHYMANGKTK